MKNLYLFVLLNVMLTNAYSQKMDDINEMIGKNQFNEARVAIEKYLSNPKKSSDAEGWYRKGIVYNSLSKESNMPMDTILALKSSSYDAFRKNQSVDSKDLFMMLENYVSYIDLYYGFYDLGVKQFNEKHFSAAMEAFKKAIEVKDYILMKKYEYNQVKLYKLDTSLVMNLAAAADNANKEDEAVKYYREIMSANVFGAEYKFIYEYLLVHYMQKDDDVSMNEILKIVKVHYPESIDTWLDTEIKAATKKGDLSLLFKKYDQLMAENPSNFILPYNYAAEMYNTLYGKDAVNAGNIDISNKLTETIKKAINNESNGEKTAATLMTNHLYNMAAELIDKSNAIKGAKSEDLKKKTDLKSLANKTMDECIVYCDQMVKFYEAISSKSAIQKANYKIILGYLSDMYNLKKNPVKAAEYDKKNAAADRM